MTYSEWHGVLLLKFQSNSGQIPSKKGPNYADHLVYHYYKLHKQLFQQRTFSINYPIYDPASATWTKRSYDKATTGARAHSALNTMSVTDQQIQAPSESTSIRPPFVWRHKQIQLKIHRIWTSKMHYFLFIYFNNKLLHDSSMLAAHHQGGHLCINSSWYGHALCWLSTGYCSTG